MDLKKSYEQYVESKRGSWSEVSLKKEIYRLRGITEEHLEQPELMYQYLKEERQLKPQAIKTIFIRAGEFVEWLTANGQRADKSNKVKAFMKERAQLFKYAQAKKEVGMSFDEAATRINTIKDQGLRTKALQLLYTGMRYDESTKLQLDGTVVGKGGHVRHVPLAQDNPVVGFEQSYHTLYRELKKIGLTPHMLRKLCATKLVELGADEADLMKLMGWRSSQMAAVYVQARRERALVDAMKEHLKGGKKDGN